MSIRNLVVHPDHFYSIYTTEKEEVFKFVMDILRNIAPKSKIVTTSMYPARSNNRKDVILIDEDYYEEALEICNERLFDTKCEKDIDWVTEDGYIVPCGYFQVARALSPNERDYTNLLDPKVNNKNEFENYRIKMSNFFRSDVKFQYDYIANIYGINVRGKNYEEEVLKFNEFVSTYGKGPFNEIKETNRYGKLTERQYPILSKRK